MPSSYKPIEKCRLCRSDALYPVLDLGNHPMSGHFPQTIQEDEALDRGPLRLVRCDECELVQLDGTYDLGTMYGSNYGYRSGLNPGMVKHLENTVAFLESVRPLKPDDIVVDIGSNDGTLLNSYSTGQRIGFDPTIPKFHQYYDEGIIKVPHFFGKEYFDAFFEGQKARIVTSIAMFYDLPDPQAFVDDVAAILRDDGVWHFEQSYIGSMMAAGSYDTVCHEHLEYYGVRQVKRMLNAAGLQILNIDFNDVNGGSFAVTAGRGTEHSVVPVLLETEKHQCNRHAWDVFRHETEMHRHDLPIMIHQLKKLGYTVAGLGASTKGNTLLNYCGLTSRDIPWIGEVNPDKFGCLTPGSRIPITRETYEGADVFVVLPWHFRKGFVERRNANAKDKKLLFPLPRVELV